MSETEKITINLSVVDLGKIDLLVEEGFYSNRTDLIRTAIRNQLDEHQEAVKQSITRRAAVVGILKYGQADLEKYRERGEKLAIRVVGMLILERTVTPELALKSIESVQILGSLRAPAAVKKALESRIS